MSTGSYSLQIFWLYNRKVAFKLETIFLSCNQARYPTDAKYSFSRKSGVNRALLMSSFGPQKKFTACILRRRYISVISVIITLTLAVRDVYAVT